MALDLNILLVRFPRLCATGKSGPGVLAISYSLHCSSFFGLTSSILGILKGNPKKELQWRL